MTSSKKIFNISPDTFENWIFDLDNTIYDNKLGLFQKISSRITLYIMENFSLDQDAASQLRSKMYQKYGLTLTGLMVERKIDPDNYLKFIHDVDHPELKADSELRELFKKLKGKKYIYTNASKSHAIGVLNTLGILEEFDDILDIKGTLYIPKPDPKSYEVMVKAFSIDPVQFSKSIFIEDTAKNLTPAKILGMTTVWVKNDFNHEDYKRNIQYVDFKVDNIKDFFYSIK